MQSIKLEESQRKTILHIICPLFPDHQIEWHNSNTLYIHKYQEGGDFIHWLESKAMVLCQERY